MSNKIIEFYSGTGTDHAGRKIETIWGWNEDKLERCHDYIQWLFPNRDRSAYNEHAPLMTDEVSRQFKMSPWLQGRALRSFETICRFYGVIYDEKHTFDFGKERPWWESERYAHNWLRMTRILLALPDFGLHANAQGFYEVIMKANVPQRTKDFWASASRRS